MARFKCKLCGFSEDRKFNRRKVLLCKFHKKILKGICKKTKLINTHFMYWNFDTPTPCLALYFTAHWTKQTLVVLQFQLDLCLTSYLIAQLVKFQLSSNMSHFLSPSKLWNAIDSCSLYSIFIASYFLL